ncbi:hypothetical protein FH5_00807 [Priestia endophytica]|nr:hypothetical protein FH5_00807 [Priestia endophytica]
MFHGFSTFIHNQLKNMRSGVLFVQKGNAAFYLIVQKSVEYRSMLQQA